MRLWTVITNGLSDLFFDQATDEVRANNDTGKKGREKSNEASEGDVSENIEKRKNI